MLAKLKKHAKTVFGLMATIFLGFTLAGLMIASKFYVIPCAIGAISLALQFVLRNE